MNKQELRTDDKTKAKLKEAADRLKLSENSVIRLLIRKYARKLK